jgi:hypothetical protein
MPTPQETLLLGFETHSTEKIQEALSTGIDVNGLLDGKTPLTLLVEMYLRSPKFSDCVRCLMQAGARCSDIGFLAVLLDDAELLRVELRRNPSLIHHRDIRCAFTRCLAQVVACGCRVRPSESRGSFAGRERMRRRLRWMVSINGHTPIFHTVCQHQNHCQPVMRLLLEWAKADIRLAGITWGKSFDWETTIFDATPVSYAQAGLLPQFQRDERDVYENIKLLTQASGRSIPEKLNVPNKYLLS